MVEKGREYFNDDDIKMILIGLKYIFENCSDQATKDNSASSLCRIMIYAPNQVPVESGLDSVLGIAPFTGDAEENKFLLLSLI